LWHEICTIPPVKGILKQMKIIRRHKLFLLFPGIFLLSLFIGMIPLNMAHRSAGGCPFAQGEQAGWTTHCPFRSLASDDNPIIATLHSPQPNQELQLGQKRAFPIFESFFNSTAFNFIPLRC
jgi:hypothetical protein